MASFVASTKLLFEDAFSSGMNRARQSFAAMSDTMNGLSERGSQLLQFSANLSQMSDHMGQLTAKMNQTLKLPSEMASKFETGLARVSTVLNKTNAVAADLPATQRLIANSAVNMAAGWSDAGKIAALSADAYAHNVDTMRSSGLTVGRAMKSLLSQNNLEQLSDTLKSVGNAATSFGLPFKKISSNLAQFHKKMLSASKAGTSMKSVFAQNNLEQLSDTLKSVSNAATSFGLPFKKISSNLAQFHKNMLAASKAGTSMKSMFSQNNLQQLSDTFESVSNAATSFGLPFKKLSNSLAQFQKNMLAASKAGKSMKSAFAQKTLQQLSDKLKSVSNGATSFGLPFKKISSNLTQFQKNMLAASKAGTSMKSMFAQLGNTGKKLASDIAEIAGGGGDLFATLGDIKSYVGSVVSMLEQAGQIMKLFSQSIGLLRNMIGTLVTSLKFAVKGIFSLARSFITALPSMGAWIASTWSLAAAYLAAYWPIYTVIAAVAAVATAAVAIIKYWQPISGFFVRLWTGIRDTIAKAWNWFLGILDSPIIAAIGLAFAPFITVPALIVKNWQSISGFFTRLWGGIKDSISKVWNWFLGIFDNPIITAIGLVFAPLITLPALIVKNWQSISGFFTRLWGGIKDSISKVWNWFLGILDNPVARTVGLIFAPFITIPKLIIDSWGKIKDFFSSLWDGILRGWSDLWENIPAPLKKFGSYLLFGKKEEGENLTSTMADGMTQGTTNLTSATAQTMQKIDEYLPHSNARKGPLSQLTASGAAIPQTLAKGFVADNSLEIASVRQATRVKTKIPPSDIGFGKSAKRETTVAPVYNITINGMNVQSDDLESLLTLLRSLVKEAA